MKTLTLIQPWATLIALKEKQIETRSWKTNYRGQIAIHAGKKIDKTVFEDPFYINIFKKYGITINNIPTSSIVAICDLTDCIHTEDILNNLTENEKKLGNYSPTRFAWILNNIQKLQEPIPAKGMLGLWEFSELK